MAPLHHHPAPRPRPRIGLSVGGLAASARLSFVKVAEFQRRGVVHFHALIRLDGPDTLTAPAVDLDAATFGEAVAMRSAS